MGTDDPDPRPDRFADDQGIADRVSVQEQGGIGTARGQLMSDAQAQKRWTLGSIVFVGGALVALVILLGLGTWQMQRLGWKEALISTIDQRVASEPRSL